MNTSVFFSKEGGGFTKAILPKNIQSYSYSFLLEWARKEAFKKSYKNYFVTNNPEGIRAIKEQA